MGKKNNKSTTDALAVVTSEPVDSIEENKSIPEEKEAEDVGSKAKTDVIGTTTADKADADLTDVTETELKSKDAPQVTSKDEETASSTEETEISATDKKETAASVNDKKDATTKSDAEESNKIDKKSETDDAPPPPPRPVSRVSQIKQDLKDAFPNIEDKLITAVLIASQGNADPAFNALLYISDPSFEAEIPEPAPSVPSKKVVNEPKNTLTDDELLARKLQHEFELEDKRRRAHHHEHERRRRRQQSQPEDDDSVDEFGQIKESFSQGFEEARTTLNGWVSGFAKKLQEPKDGSGSQLQESQSQNPKLFGALGGSSYTKQNKNNTFDEDPRIISNDLHSQINLKDNDEDEVTSPSLPERQGAQAGNEKSAQSDSYIDSNKKWQPLNSDVPVDSNAFLVTDSEDEDTGVANYDTKKTRQTS